MIKIKKPLGQPTPGYVTRRRKKVRADKRGERPTRTPRTWYGLLARLDMLAAQRAYARRSQ